MQKFIGAQVGYFAPDQMPVEAEIACCEMAKTQLAKTFAMSAFGTKRTKQPNSRLSAIGPKQTPLDFGPGRFVRL